MAKSIRKNKKNKYDSILPRVGLNPAILPDKGPNAWSSFNSMNTPSSDFGGMMEELNALSEAAFNDKDPSTAITSCFSSNTIKIMEKCGKIINSDDSKILDFKNYNYLPSELNPSTQDLCFYSNPSGRNDPEARNERAVIHCVFGVHPTRNKDKNVLYEITVPIPLQYHTKLHNNVFKLIAEKAYKNTDAKKAAKKYIEGLKTINAELATTISPQSETTSLQSETTSSRYKNISPKKAADLFWRKVELKAWFIREIWSLDSIFDLRKEHNKDLADTLRDYIVSSPALILNKLNNYFKLGDKYFAIILNSIGDNQLNTVDRVGLNDLLRDDFICAIEVDPKTGKPGKEQYTDFNSFINKYGKYLSVNQSINEDDNEKEFRKIDLKKYIEHNLAKKHLVSSKSSEANKNDSMAYSYQTLKSIISRYLTADIRKKIWGDRYLYEDEVFREMWRAPFGSELYKIKQKSIAEFVRYLITYANDKLTIYVTSDPIYDENDGLYKVRIGDIILAAKEGSARYEIDDNRNRIIPIEDIFDYIRNKKYINLQVSDYHFLDSSGNIVPGVKFQFNSNNEIVDILTLASCEREKVYKIIVDAHIVYLSSISLGSMQRKAGLNNVDTIEIIGNILRPNSFSSVSCNKVIFTNFTSSYIPTNCFARMKCSTFNIPESVNSLHDGAFKYSSLNSIFIPESVIYIGKSCFEGCYSLTINFEITKAELPTGRSLYANHKYSGLNGKWGKTDVKKITYGNPVMLEGLLKEDDDFIDDTVGEIILDSPNWLVYMMSDTDQAKGMHQNLIDTGTIPNMVDNMLSYSSDAYRVLRDNHSIYMAINKKEENSFIIYNPMYKSVLIFDKDTPWGQHISLSKLFSEDKLKEVRDLFIFDNRVKGFDNLKDILSKQGITKDTPLDDKKYFLKGFVYPASSYASDNSLLKVITKTLEAGDFETALDLCGIKYPEYSDFESKVNNILDSDEGKQILEKNKLSDRELKDIIKNVTIATLVDTKVNDIKDYINNKSKESGLSTTNFEKGIAKVHILELFDTFKDTDANNIEDRLDQYIDRKANRVLSTISRESMVNNLSKYTLNKKQFLNNLENELNYYNRG